jgi:hypothetical protein
MKNISIIVLTFLAINVYGKAPNSDSLKILELKKENQTLTITNKELLEKIQNYSKEEFIEKASVWISLASTIGGLLAFLGVWWGLKGTITQRTNSFLEKETEKGLSKIVQEKYGEILRDTELIKRAKILVINELGTDIPKVFQELMKEYSNIQYHDIAKIEDIIQPVLINICSLFDLIIIEDMVSDKRWMVNPRNYTKFDGGKDKVEKNDKILVEFCKQVSPKSAVLYYGDGLLGKETIGDSEKEQYISFANAPATLLQNVFNLLKLNQIGKSISS